MSKPGLNSLEKKLHWPSSPLFLPLFSSCRFLREYTIFIIKAELNTGVQLVGKSFGLLGSYIIAYLRIWERDVVVDKFI